MRRLGIVVSIALIGATSGCRKPAAKVESKPVIAESPKAAPAPPVPVVIDNVDHGATLLGGERGVDHVGVAVKDLASATHVYHDILGFSRPTEGKLPNGIRNVNYYFSDSSYLETLTYWDRDKAAWLVDFTDKHSGAPFAVLSAYSPEATTEFLGKRGLKMGAVYGGSIKLAGQPEAMRKIPGTDPSDSGGAPDESWQTFFLPNGTLSGDPLYFIAYPRKPRDEFLRKLGDHAVRRIFYHDNTALGLKAIWIAVADLAAATRTYESIGLVRDRQFVDAALGAKGQVFKAGEGEIWLLAGDSPKSRVNAFLRERGGSGVMGMSLIAGSVPAAARLISTRTKQAMVAYEGQLGNSIRVPPEIALGVWIEFAQYLVPKSGAN